MLINMCKIKNYFNVKNKKCVKIKLLTAYPQAFNKTMLITDAVIIY
ncbi:MAG: hypothetical protein FWF46_07770 [Oscillospiraceae bacterium]|nr:hypothetical protein [Oscillospiraceae bacterium]